MEKFNSTYSSTKESKMMERKRTKRESKDLHLCDRCAQTFVGFEELERHQWIHSEPGAYMCATCAKTFHREDDLTHHELTHSPIRTFDCEECGAMFATRPDLDQHTKVHKRCKYQCDCGRDFLTKAALTKHTKSHLRKKKGTTAATESRDRSIDSCTDIREVNDSKKSQNYLRRGGIKKKYMCPVCEKTYLSLSYFNKHLFTHKGPQCFKCKKCDVTFAHKRELDRHMRDQRIHCRCRNCISESKNNVSEEETYKCSFCDVEFATKKSLHDHVRDHKDYINEMVLQTETDDMVQNDVISLHNEIRLEATAAQATGDDELELSEERVHTQRRLEGTNSKETKSLHVDKQPERSKKRTNTKLYCDQCNESFATKRKLNKHVHSHVGRVPHVCVTCGKTCTQLGQINIHVLLDKGIKDFKCEECLTFEYIKGPVTRRRRRNLLPMSHP